MQHSTDLVKINVFLQFAHPVMTGFVESVLRSTQSQITRHGQGLKTYFSIRTGDSEARFYMQNLLLEIATLDRDAQPLKFDQGLENFDYFTDKAIRVTQAKMKVLCELLSKDNIDDAIKSIEKSAGQYERLRICKFDKNQTR